jgi:hypothetical protein
MVECEEGTRGAKRSYISLLLDEAEGTVTVFVLMQEQTAYANSSASRERGAGYTARDSRCADYEGKRGERKETKVKSKRLRLEGEETGGHRRSHGREGRGDQMLTNQSMHFLERVRGVEKRRGRNAAQQALCIGKRLGCLMVNGP